MIEPNGKTFEVPVADLFFSTTNSKGVIDEANETFCRISGFSRKELIGAPHNVVRHRNMPAGVFKSFWDLLRGGHPACGYVLNSAKDGTAYWAFATIVPIGDRYISVRSKPCDEQMVMALAAEYENVRALEFAALDEGKRKGQVGELGQQAIENSMVSLGFEDYRDFMLDLLPRELHARRQHVPALPTASLSDPAYVSIAERTDAVNDKLTFLGDGIARAVNHVTSLTNAARGAATSVGQIRTALEEIIELCPDGGEGDRLVLNALPAVRTKAAALVEALEPIQEEIDTVVGTRRMLRFDVEVARLQNEAIARYVIAVDEGAENAEVSSQAITSLAEALYNLVNAELERDIAASGELQGELKKVGAALKVFDLVTEKWREMVGTRGMAKQFEAVLPQLDARREQLAREVERIREAVEGLVSALEGFDLEGLRSDLRAIVSDAEKFGGPRDAGVELKLVKDARTADPEARPTKRMAL